MSGAFTATCMDSIPVTGTASGQLTSATTVTIVITASGTLPTGPCTISVSANGTLQDSNTLSAQYSGTTCLGPFSGSDVLHRSDFEKRPDPPAPPAPPPPPPHLRHRHRTAQEAWELCAPLAANKPGLVQCVHDAINPGASGTLAFEVTKRVAWLLRGEGVGLLEKDGGENIISWQGHSLSISRVCYPDGHIFKVITDAGDGGTNGATWSDDDFVDARPLRAGNRSASALSLKGRDLNERVGAAPHYLARRRCVCARAAWMMRPQRVLRRRRVRRARAASPWRRIP